MVHSSLLCQLQQFLTDNVVNKWCLWETILVVLGYCSARVFLYLTNIFEYLTSCSGSNWSLTLLPQSIATWRSTMSPLKLHVSRYMYSKRNHGKILTASGLTQTIMPIQSSYCSRYSAWQGQWNSCTTKKTNSQTATTLRIPFIPCW